MSRARAQAAVIVLFAASLIAAPGAFAASPQTIYRDYADNGRLDGTYSARDLQRALDNAAVQAYGNGKGQGLKPAVEKQINSKGSQKGSQAGGVSPAAVQKSGGLPFTGLDLGLIALGALGLLLLGAALRRVSRQRV